MSTVMFLPAATSAWQFRAGDNVIIQGSGIFRIVEKGKRSEAGLWVRRLWWRSLFSRAWRKP